MDFLDSEIRARRWSKGELAERSGVPRQRWSEFGKGRALTGRYFLKYMEGLNLTVERVEQKSGLKMTKEQKREIQIEAWQSAHRDLIEAMIDNPALVKVLQAAVKTLERQ